MRRFLVIFLLCSTQFGFAQTSEKYNGEYAEFYRAEDLFEKEQFGAARKTFRQFIEELDRPNDPFYIKARYYEAVSALELYNNDAIDLLEGFNRDYPESIYKKDIYFRLGRYYYRKKKYEDALTWFNKLSIQDVEEENRDEFYFKVGYANFKEENFDAARNAFYEIKDGDSQYSAPALYYYSHIAYQDGSYQLALEGFLKLKDHEKFGKVVPYYIAQIYYLQGDYEAVTNYAPQLAGKGNVVNENDVNHLIGDAYYRTGKYDEAIPFLEKYNKASVTTRDDDYRLGYAYYKSGYCSKAIKLFDRVKKVSDSLGQVAYYHIGECLIKMDDKVAARAAFHGAALIDKDPVIQEDALYNYAILSYKLDINPYDEAVEAFEMYLNKYPNSKRKEDVYQYLVNVYMSTNNYQKALNSLDKLPNKDIKLKTAYQIIAFNQGVKRFQESNYAGAVSSFNLVKKYPIDPKVSAQGVYWTAEARFRQKRYDQAITDYKNFLALPNTLLPALREEAYYNMGYAYLRKGGVLNPKFSKSIRDKMIESFRLYTQSSPANKRKKTDAYLRLGDAYFSAPQIYSDRNEQAIKHYQLALEEKAGFEDQALYYMAITYGYNGQEDEKIVRLLDIVNNYTNSKYVQIATYEIANTYNSLGNLSKALQYYKKVVFDYPNSDKVVDSKLSIADIYYKQGDPSKAESEYRAIIEQHGSDKSICARAARALQDMFLAEGQPERVEEIVDQYPCADLSAEERENIYYLPAMTVYTDSTKSENVRYTEAIPMFDKYLGKFPNGRYSVEVRYYLANCHYTLGDIAKAVEIYREMLEGPTTGYTVYAADRVSHYLYEEEKYEEAIPYYKKMEQISSNPEKIFHAQLQLMRCNYFIENWTNASSYADKLLASPQVTSEIQLWANYAKGIANYKLENYNKALAPLTWVVENNTTIKAFECKFAIADIYYKKSNFDLSDQHITELLKMKPTNNYWIAKGLILRTRILIAKDDLFAAEENLRSVIEHYPNTDDGVMEEANQLWDELMQLKEVNKDINDDDDGEIEINGDGNGE